MSEDRYIVTARKYRPQLFKDLVGQSHVADTLRNALALDRLGHAYLFSGPRGVGKTTSARILAKAINCLTLLEERDNGEPCRSCESCLSFEEGRSLNIIEIDAASNNSVDDIRALRDKVIIPPQGAKKKVYIIDEVHMLSTAAFNAFLKVLEEPPPHALFIFATTEPHKVLATILSRCQRFDFRRIGVPDMIAHLRNIATQEGISSDEESLLLVARKGDGSLRDALSVFDQAVALCGTDLVYAPLAKALGVIEIDQYFEVTTHIATSDKAGVFTLVQNLTETGGDYHEFLLGLSEHLRNLLVVQTLNNTALIVASEAIKKRYEAIQNTFQKTDLLQLMSLVSDAEQALKNNPQPRLRLELLLLKMVSLPQQVELQKLISGIEALQKKIAEGHPVSLQAATTSVATSKPTSQPPKDTPEPKSAEPSKVTEPSPPTFSFAPPKAEPPPKQEELTIDTDSVQQLIPNLFGPPALKKSTKPPPKTENRLSYETVEAPVMVAENDQDRIFFVLKQKWDSFLQKIKKERIHVGALLQHAHLSHAHRNEIILQVPDDFHKKMLTHQKDFLLDNLKKIVEEETVPSFTFEINAESKAEKPQDESETLDPYEQLQRLRQNNPIVRNIIDQFGGEIVW